VIEFLVALLAIWAIFSLPSALVGAGLVWRHVFSNPGAAFRFVVVPWAAWLMFFLFVGKHGSLTTAIVSNVLVGLVEGIALTIIIKNASERRARNIVLDAASLVAVLIWAFVPVMGE
jgi:hypothetical protein